MRGCDVLGLFVLFLTHLYTSQCAKKVIFISFDGFRHDYLDMAKVAGKNISAFEQIREAGFQAEVQNVMLTLTFPSHYAMATGRNVENHGLVGNTFHTPDMKSYYYTNNTNNLEAEWFEYGNVEPLWETNQRHGGRSCVFQWVGSEARVHNKMAFATSGVYNDAYDLTWRINRIIDWISRDEFNLAMMYYNQPDKYGHTYGPDSPEVMDQVELANAGVAYLLQRIQQTPSLKDNVNLVISSDHGMTTVDPVNRVIDLFAKLDRPEIAKDGSPATLGLWPRYSNITIEELYNLIKGTPHLDVYYKEEIPDRYFFKKNPRIAPVYGIAENGWLISTQNRPYTNLLGMHGYDNAVQDMHPFMVAMGPDIKAFTERQSFYQVDLYPFICALLGLDKPNRIDGLIDRVVPFLKTPPTDVYLKQFRNYASGALVP